MGVVTPKQAGEHLGLPSERHSQLQGDVAAAEAAVAHLVGPLELQEPVTEHLTGHTVLVLPAAPVHEVTLVRRAGVTISPHRLDKAAGLVYLSGGYPGDYEVTYTAGRAEVPADLILAIKEAVRHLWEARNGGSTYGPAGTPIEELPQVRALIAPHLLPPSIA